MDRRTLRSNSCNSAGGKSLAVGPFSVARTTSAPAAAAGSKEDVGERKALLPPRRPPGGTARKGQKGPKRRVQWKDTHGKKLTEVLEFQPSLRCKTAIHERFKWQDCMLEVSNDSSDSDDEYLDTCICSIM